LVLYEILVLTFIGLAIDSPFVTPSPTVCFWLIGSIFRLSGEEDMSPFFLFWGAISGSEQTDIRIFSGKLEIELLNPVFELCSYKYQASVLSGLIRKIRYQYQAS